VQVEDAGQHPRLPGVELPAAERLGDQHLELLGRAALVELVGLGDAEHPQHRVRDGVEQVDERAERLGEQLQRAGDPPRDGLGPVDREDLRDLLADRDVQRRGDDVGEPEGDGQRDGVGDAVTEDPLEDVRDRRLAEEADAQRGERDAELAGGQVARQVVELAQHEARARDTLLRLLLDPRLADAHERELGSDEEPVEQHEHEDREQEQDGHRRS
jgi:hypothetical protein